MWCDRSRPACECNHVVHRNSLWFNLKKEKKKRFSECNRMRQMWCFLWKPCGCLSEKPFTGLLTWLVKLHLSRKIWLTCSGTVNEARVRCQTVISKHKITRRPVNYGNLCHEYLIISVLLAAAVHISEFFTAGLQLRQGPVQTTQLRGLGPHLGSSKTTHTRARYIKRVWS